MTIAIPAIVGESISRTTDQTAGLTFENCYEGALQKARLSTNDADLVQAAKDLVNEFHEQLCVMAPEAPFMRRVARLTTNPALTGTLATWTQGSPTVTLDASEALTAAQMLAYPGSRITNPTEPGYYFINAIPDPTTITLDTAYVGADTTEGGWQISRDVYKLPTDFGRMISIESPQGRPSLEYQGEVALRELYMLGTQVGTPRFYSYVYHGDGVRRLLLMDAPDEAMVYTLTYSCLLTRMTQDAAIPYVPVPYRQLLVYGPASVLVLLHREDPELAAMLQSLYNPMWTRFIAEYAPERTQMQLRLPSHLRPFRPRLLRGHPMQVTAEWFARQGGRL